MDMFFDRSPLRVAKDLLGKTLQVEDKLGIITAVMPQYQKDNSNWLHRPIFGEHPVDAYVAPYRGNHLLFLRTGATNTCVRIDAIEVDGQHYRTPGGVCKALGIKSERTGNVAIRGYVVTVT